MTRSFLFTSEFLRTEVIFFFKNNIQSIDKYDSKVKMYAQDSYLQSWERGFYSKYWIRVTGYYLHTGNKIVYP